jgi:hypothetical protein
MGISIVRVRILFKAYYPTFLAVFGAFSFHDPVYGHACPRVSFLTGKVQLGVG